MNSTYARIGHFRSTTEFRGHLATLGIDLPLDEAVLSAAAGSPLAAAIEIGGRRVGNRWCIHPMEGWDGTADGGPSERTLRRWQNFGRSGAKLLWGGEAFAVRHDGRANPRQLCHGAAGDEGLKRLLDAAVSAHAADFGATDDLLVGLQLTHSGRYSRPNRSDRGEPRIAYHHPVLDGKCGIAADDDAALLSDDDLRRLVDDYARAARAAAAAGFHFVDVKCCHGYLVHELLSAFDRPGPYGGPLENRARFLCEAIEAVQAAAPGLLVGVRLSLFDAPPYRPDPAAPAGEPAKGVPHDVPRPYPGFGCRRDDPATIDLAEPIALLTMLRAWGVAAVNLTAGSPYYNPHVQRPAYYPPSDGYQPPEDPLVGCWRQIDAVRQAKAAVPGLPMVGTAYTYLQEYLPQVAQAVVRAGWVDIVGVGRMVLSYWELPADVLAGRPMQTKRICRTFSDCTTGPRSGLPSGCYPLDPYYKAAEEAAALKEVKARLRRKATPLEGGSPG